MKNKVMLIILSILILVSVILGISYAFFAVSENIVNNVQVSINFSNDTLEGNFIVTGGQVSNLFVNEELSLVDSTGNVMASSDGSMEVNLTSPFNVTCSYDLVWVWDNDSDEYYKSNTLEDELVINGNNTGSSFEKELNNYGFETNLGTYFIETNNGNSIQTWNYTLNFYNLNTNQDNHAGKTYKGKVFVRNVLCSKRNY